MAKGEWIFMSSIRDRAGVLTKMCGLNEVESPDDRILAALSKLPRPGQCRFISESGEMCQRRHIGNSSWCPECQQRVAAPPKKIQWTMLTPEEIRDPALKQTDKV
jgi:hypothetical protein